MATVTLTSLYSQLDSWPGNLFQVQGSATIPTRTATQMVIVHGAGSESQSII